MLLGLWVAIGAEEGRALRVTDDTARHLRYTSRAKREADVSLSHRCTMEHPLHHGAPRWLHLPRAGSGGGSKLRPTCWRSFVRSPHVVGRRRCPRRGKRPGRASGGRPCVTRHGRHRTSPTLHVTRKTRSRRLAVAPSHHGASRCTMEHHERCDGCYHPETDGES